MSPLVHFGVIIESAATGAWVGAVILGGGMAARIFYYAIPEHLWGASPGKLLCDLRVVDASRCFPSWPKAFVRASVFSIVPFLPGVLYAFFTTGSNNPLLHPWQFGGNTFFVTALMFVAARRTNGFAALHDWASGTRVIERSAYQEGRPLAEKSDESVPVPAPGARIGPYGILERLQETPTEEWLLGLDAPLARKVWIRKFKDATVPAMDPRLRTLHRPGRLRWLNGRRAPGDNWDAYEALSGQPLVALIGKRQSWSDVRLWLLDLAQELNAAIKDGPLPADLCIERVWITGTGHAKLLDFPPPGAPLPKEPPPPPRILDDAEARRFLRHLALCALEGCCLPAEEAHMGRSIAAPLPLHGRAFFQELPDFLDLSELVGRLRAMIHQPAAVTRQRKLMVIAGCALPVALIFVLSLTVMYLLRNYLAANSDAAKVERCLERWQEIAKNPATNEPAAERAALETFVAANFEKATFKALDSGPVKIDNTLPADLRKLGAAIKARHPIPSPQELAQAEATLGPLLVPSRLETKFEKNKQAVLVKAGLGCLMVLPLFGVLSALILRRGLVLRVARIEIVTRDGAPARRWRLFLRALLTWSPLFLADCVAWGGDLGPVCWIFGIIFLGGVASAITTPERSLADRIMGTWLAPA